MEPYKLDSGSGKATERRQMKFELTFEMVRSLSVNQQNQEFIG